MVALDRGCGGGMLYNGVVTRRWNEAVEEVSVAGE
jgi:hypothetical protein